jgi:hypothetical protein
MYDADQNAALDRRPWIRWPHRILGPRPGLKELNLASWTLFLLLMVLPSLFVFFVQNRTEAAFPKLRFGFVYFYGIGQIANEYPATRLYDYDLQQKVFTGIRPLGDHFYGPSPYPPFVALFFSLFARVPFNLAYLLWTGLSLILYGAGILATAEHAFPGERLRNSLILCYSLAFFPFIFYTLLNGRISALAVFAAGLAVFLEGRSKPFQSGLALSLLAYKPPFLLLAIPMLLVTRRFKAFYGFLSGAMILIGLTTVFTGVGIWPVYARFLASFGKFAGVGGHSSVNLSRYIDCSSVSHAIPGGRSTPGLAVLAVAVAAVATALAVLLWKSVGAGRPVQQLAWAATLTWTMILNVYVPLYDSILVVVAIVLTLGALKTLQWRVANGWIGFLSFLIFAGAFVTETIAKDHGVQILSLLFASLGIAQLFLLHLAIRHDASNRTSSVSAVVAL